MELNDELSRVFMVREFADVFEPVVGLLLKRATELWKYLILEAEPVSRLPSRMTLSEISELKVPLLDLEHKIFVRLCIDYRKLNEKTTKYR